MTSRHNTQCHLHNADSVQRRPNLWQRRPKPCICVTEVTIYHGCHTCYSSIRSRKTVHVLTFIKECARMYTCFVRFYFSACASNLCHTCYSHGRPMYYSAGVWCMRLSNALTSTTTPNRCQYHDCEAKPLLLSSSARLTAGGSAACLW